MARAAVDVAGQALVPTLADASGERRTTVNSVHEQGVDRLGSGLTIEATFFELIGRALRAGDGSVR